MKKLRLSHGQQWLFNTIKYLGMATTPHSKGLCLGISCIAMEAMVSNNIKLFNDTFETIKNLSIDPPSEESALADADIRKAIQKIIEYQHPKRAALPALFQLFDNRHSIETMSARISDTSYTLSQKYPDDVGYLSTLYFIDIIENYYSTSSLGDLLLSLQDMLSAKENQNLSLAFLLTAGTHAIAISFNSAENIWYVVNPSGLPTKEASTADLTSRMIFNAFRLALDKDEKINLKMRIFSTRANAYCAEILIHQWRLQQCYYPSPYLEMIRGQRS